MSGSGFPAALSFILDREGGYVDDPDDMGGATNQGITQATYDRSRSPLRSLPVRGITDEEVADIYLRNYWLAGRCNEMPWPLSLAHFDGLVQHRPKAAKKMLQRALGVTVDGIVGDITIAAAKAAPSEYATRTLIAERKSYYRGIVINKPVQKKFLKGWENRLKHLRAATGV